MLPKRERRIGLMDVNWTEEEAIVWLENMPAEYLVFDKDILTEMPPKMQKQFMEFLAQWYNWTDEADVSIPAYDVDILD